MGKATNNGTKFVPFSKQSKRAQRERNASQRVTWQINPVTRKPLNPNAYKRKKPRDTSESNLGFFMPYNVWRYGVRSMCDAS